MPHRELLTESQRLSLHAPASDERGMVRHYTLSSEDLASGDLAHLSPLGWEHINLTGDYHWDTSPTLGPDEFRPLRTHAHDFAAAA